MIMSRRTEHQRAAVRLAVLLTTALVSVLRGVYYLTRPADAESTDALTIVEWWLPLEAWGIVWIALGVAIVATAHRCTKASIIMLSVFVGLHVIWAGSYLGSWLVLDSPGAWISASNMAGTAALTAVLVYVLEHATDATRRRP